MTMKTISFSTLQLRAHATLPAWKDILSQVYYSVDVLPKESNRVRGELHETRLGQVGISRFCGDEQRVFRYAKAAQKDGAENFVFIFPVHKEMFFTQRGRSGTVAPGGVALLNSGEFYEASCPDGFENLTIKVPSEILRRRLSWIDDACATRELATPAMAKAIVGLASPLLAPDSSLSDHQSGGVAETIIDLLELMLESGPGPDTGLGRSSAVLHKAQLFIRNNLSNHELTPELVSKAVGISVRYLHKLYASSGTTFGRALLTMRLEEACRLSRSADGCMTLQQIAFTCGFNSQSHFSTAFKAHFGMTPKMARKGKPEQAGMDHA